MGLEKRPSAKSGNVTVIFRVPADAAAGSAALLGEFTDWTPVAMQPRDDGGHELVVDLEPGAAYRFRYLLDGERWVNDWAADAYVANDYGSDDSVVMISDNVVSDKEHVAGAAAPANAKPKRAPRKAAAKTPGPATKKAGSQAVTKAVTKAAPKPARKAATKPQNGVAAAAAEAKAAVVGEVPKPKRAPRKKP